MTISLGTDCQKSSAATSCGTAEPERATRPESARKVASARTRQASFSVNCHSRSRFMAATELAAGSAPRSPLSCAPADPARRRASRNTRRLCHPEQSILRGLQAQREREPVGIERGLVQVEQALCEEGVVLEEPIDISRPVDKSSLQGTRRGVEEPRFDKTRRGDAGIDVPSRLSNTWPARERAEIIRPFHAVTILRSRAGRGRAERA